MKKHRRTPTRTAGALAALALLVPVLLVGCGDDDEEAGDTTTTEAAADSEKAELPEISDVWARPATDTGAVYMTITAGKEEDHLVKASVPADIAGTVELHETTTEGSSTTMGGDMAEEPTTTMGGTDSEGGSTTTMAGMMGMRPVDEITIPAGETVTLKPGGYHIMLLDLAKELKVGDTVPVTLTFEHAGETEVTAEVRDA